MFSPSTDPKMKIVPEYEKLARIIQALREACGIKVACTIGTWDLLHVGHLRYIGKAKEHGDILVVGADSDRAVKLYKGPTRPIVPQDERAEMLAYSSAVSFVTFVDDVSLEDGWQYSLLDCIKPDVFVAVEDSYPENQRAEIIKRCGELVVLPRQAAETSTTSNIRKLMIGDIHQLAEGIQQVITDFLHGKAR